MTRRRSAFTLVELLAVLVLLGLLTGLALPALARRSMRDGNDEVSPRTEAIISGRALTVIVDSGGSWITYLPDGQAVVIRGSGIDPLTGKVR